MAGHNDHHGDSEDYHAKDALGPASSAGLKLGFLGALGMGLQGALTKQNIGVTGVLRRYGGTAGTFAATGFAYIFVRNVTANLREKDDHLSSALGGAVAGAIIGARRGRLTTFLGLPVVFAVATGLMTYTGGTLRGAGTDPDADRYGEKEKLRKQYRLPVEQTIQELGEGRGIYAPGWEERRKQRLKETYGIEVP